jgi:hypothetical protein
MDTLEMEIFLKIPCWIYNGLRAEPSHLSFAKCSEEVKELHS